MTESEAKRRAAVVGHLIEVDRMLKQAGGRVKSLPGLYQAQVASVLMPLLLAVQELAKAVAESGVSPDG